MAEQNSGTTRQQAEEIPQLDMALLGSEIGERIHLGIGDSWVERLPHFTDARGSLTPLELGKGFPFEPKRIFLVYAVQDNQLRGEHAHRQCKQFLVAVHGGISVIVDDGHHRKEIRLDTPTTGLYLAPMVWGVQYKFDADAVLMVAASHNYEPDDYIRDYEVFLSEIGKR